MRSSHSRSVCANVHMSPNSCRMSSWSSMSLLAALAFWLRCFDDGGTFRQRRILRFHFGVNLAFVRRGAVLTDTGQCVTGSCDCVGWVAFNRFAANLFVTAYEPAGAFVFATKPFFLASMPHLPPGIGPKYSNRANPGSDRHTGVESCGASNPNPERACVPALYVTLGKSTS